METNQATAVLEKALLSQSRAVLRRIEPGEHVSCPSCGERVKFQAKRRENKVICNVYVDGRWNRVEHYHEVCYITAGEPHGVADTEVPRHVNRRRGKSS